MGDTELMNSVESVSKDQFQTETMLTTTNKNKSHENVLALWLVSELSKRY